VVYLVIVADIVIEGNFAYSFMLGMLAAVNPCGFVLLPAYLLYFLGIDGDNQVATRAPLQRALRVSAAVSAGFLVVFLVVGSISRLFTQWIELNAKYAGFVIGLVLVGLGISMLFGWKPSFATSIPGAKKDHSTRAMFVFGVGYAIASIGCTIGLLTTAILGSISTNGFASGVISIVMYGLGMSLLVTALTVTLAAAKTGLSKMLKRSLRYIDKVAAGFIAVTGVYLTWYWYGAISERSSLGNVVSNVENWQNSVSLWIQQIGATRLALIFAAVIGVALVVVGLGRMKQLVRGSRR
jgi:cytochrome c biogenesis protein CcdA